MGRRLTRIVVVVALMCSVVPALIATAQNLPEQSIVITTPKEGDSVVNTAAEVSGTAPPSTVVTVVVTDTDTNRAGVAHQENGKVEGTVTTGDDGHWTYVPQHMLVPGPFSAKASYTNDQNQVVDSKPVSFVVLNSKGSSVQFSGSLIKRLLVWGGLFLVLVIGIVVFLTNRRHRMDVKKIATNADAIENELKHTRKQLIRTNAEIAELNERIEKQKKPPGSTTPGVPQSG